MEEQDYEVGLVTIDRSIVLGLARGETGVLVTPDKIYHMTTASFDRVTPMLTPEEKQEVWNEMQESFPHIQRKNVAIEKSRRKYHYAGNELRNFRTYEAYKGNVRKFKQAFRNKNGHRSKRVVQSLIAQWE